MKKIFMRCALAFSLAALPLALAGCGEPDSKNEPDVPDLPDQPNDEPVDPNYGPFKANRTRVASMTVIKEKDDNKQILNVDFSYDEEGRLTKIVSNGKLPHEVNLTYAEGKVSYEVMEYIDLSMSGELFLDENGRGVKGSTVEYGFKENKRTDFTLHYDEQGRLIRSVTDKGNGLVYDAEIKWGHDAASPEYSLLLSCQWMDNGVLKSDVAKYTPLYSIINDLSIDLSAMLMVSEGWDVAFGDESGIFAIAGLLGEKSGLLPAVVSEGKEPYIYTCDNYKHKINIYGQDTTYLITLKK